MRSPLADSRGRALFVTLFAIAVVLVGCAPATPAPTPTLAPTLGVEYGPALPPTKNTEPTSTAAPPTRTPEPPKPTITPSVTPTPPPPTNPAPEGGTALTIIHTNDVYGHIDPCG